MEGRLISSQKPLGHDVGFGAIFVAKIILTTTGECRGGGSGVNLRDPILFTPLSFLLIASRPIVQEKRGRTASVLSNPLPSHTCLAFFTSQPLPVEQFEWRQRAVRDAFGKAVQMILSTLTFVVRCQRLNSDSHEIGISYRHGDPHGFNAWKLLVIGLED